MSKIIKESLWFFSILQHICTNLGAHFLQLTIHFLITSESIKPRQIAVMIHYCNLSRFFWLRRYDAQFLTARHYIYSRYTITFLWYVDFRQKNLSNFVSLPWKLDDPYYQTSQPGRWGHPDHSLRVHFRLFAGRSDGGHQKVPKNVSRDGGCRHQ